MIVKNEQDVLFRCLSSAKSFVDEIIIVDTGSTDNTKKIALQFGCRVYDFEWCDDFSKARNFAFEQAKYDYIMWLDADDVVPKATANFLLNTKKHFASDVYMMRYDIAFLDGKPSFSYFRERIIRRCENASWQGAVHECIAPFGKIEYLDYPVEHRKIKFEQSYRNLRIYQNIKKQRNLTAREQYYFARELYDHKKYKSSLAQLKKFLKNKEAWTENKIDALFLMSQIYLNFDMLSDALNCLFKTFSYDTPRANICCKIGDCFLNNKQYKTACYWYNTAIRCDNILNKGCFVETIYYNYYPYLQLCLCYYYLRDIKKAIYFNEMAAKFYPQSSAVIHNRLFFENLNVNFN